MIPEAFPEIAWSALAPELVLVFGAVALLLLDVQRKPGVKVLWVMSLVILAVALALGVWQWIAATPEGEPIFGGMLLFDRSAALARLVVLGVTIQAMAAARSLFAHLGNRAAEGLALVLLAAAGFILMAASQNLVMMFLGLEMGSISLYILAGIAGDGVRSDEAALKYLLLGAVASAVFIYGAALVFAGTGSLDLLGIGEFFARNLLLSPAVLLVGIGLLTAGLSFKVAAAPFHVWAPDVYQGAPAGIVGYMAAVAKVGGFAALARVLLSGFENFRPDWAPIVAGIAALSMVVGALMAIISSDIRRLLAYSGVAHAGFILTGLASGVEGSSSVWFYLAVYTVQLVAAFSVISVVGGAASSGSDLSDYRGLYRRSPFLALVLSVALLGMAGLPLTTGFVAKLGVFLWAWRGDLEWLVVVAVVASAMAIYLYLRVIVIMYMQSPVGDDPVLCDRPTSWALGAATAVTVVLGVFPQPLLRLVETAIYL
ncbi:MAG: NADH-quinone oxidoreductase subunit N [bacterium]|nr:NADH-quinone oxidoreductase subunit N [bacterium]MDE0601367.1 NADH-quinone oxidoreductase subunit N [bacterium]